MPNDSSSVFTIEDLADYLKISKSTLYKLAQNGVLPGIKVGRHWRFHRDAVDEWLKRHPDQLDKEETKAEKQETRE